MGKIKTKAQVAMVAINKAKTRSKKGQVVSLIRKDKATKAHRIPTGALRQDSNLLVAIMARQTGRGQSCSNRFLMPVPVICVVTHDAQSRAQPSGTRAGEQ